MNESIFFLHIFAVIAFVLIALRLGKTALTALAALQGVLANVFVIKQIVLFGFAVTCSDVFAIGGILSLNLLQEYFGKESAQTAIKASLLTLLFFALMSQIHLFYLPAPFDSTQSAFYALFSSSPRIVFASLCAFYLVQKFSVRFFGWLKGPLAVRITISLLVSQLFDTLLFSFLGLYGIVESLFDVIALSFLIKCAIILCSSPLTAFAKRFVKHEIPI